MCGYCRDRFAGALHFMWTQFDVDVDSKEIGNNSGFVTFLLRI